MKRVFAALMAGLLSVTSAHAGPAGDLGMTDGNEYGPAAALVILTAFPRSMICGPAMTDEACKAVQDNLALDLAENPEKLRAFHLKVIESRFGSLDAAVKDWQARPEAVRESPVCQPEPMTWRCETLVDAMFAGGLLDYLMDARKAAAKEVPEFYKDGRPFED